MNLKLTILILFFLTVPIFSQVGSSAILRGQLLKSNGKPLPYTEIELVPVESNKLVIDPKLVAISNISGKFTFFDVPNGRYTLSINFDDKPTDLSPYSTFFYPKTDKRSEAEVFEVKDRSLIKTITFRVPPALNKSKITEKVMLPNGDSVEGAYIFLRDVFFDTDFLVARIQSGKNGEFTLTAFEGRKYQVGAILYEKQPKSPPFDFGKLLAATETDIFELTPKTANLRLVLGKEDKDFNRLLDKYIGQLFLQREIFSAFAAPK